MDEQGNGHSGNGHAVINREFFRNKARRIHRFDSKTMGETIYFRALSGSGRAEFGKLYNQYKETGLDEQTRQIIIPMLSKSLVDAAGNQVYRVEDEHEIGDFDADVFDEISQELLRISGLGTKAVEEAEKNSVPTQSADSSSVSH